jgi:hypothetical protein
MRRSELDGSGTMFRQLIKTDDVVVVDFFARVSFRALRVVECISDPYAFLTTH